MTFPPHIALSLLHNEHKTYYQTVAEYTEHDEAFWVSANQRQKAYQSDELWELQWCPNNPVGHFYLRAAELEVLLMFAAGTMEQTT